LSAGVGEPGPMTPFIDTVHRLSRLCGVLAVFLLLAAVIVVCHLVFVRYVLRESAIWQHEFVTFSLIAATFLGSPYVLLTRGHVNVDLLAI
jgi:TRAP-type C4-dicarboxylate transport system permease small subunit